MACNNNIDIRINSYSAVGISTSQGSAAILVAMETIGRQVCLIMYPSRKQDREKSLTACDGFQAAVRGRFSVVGYTR